MPYPSTTSTTTVTATYTITTTATTSTNATATAVVNTAIIGGRGVVNHWRQDHRRGQDLADLFTGERRALDEHHQGWPLRVHEPGMHETLRGMRAAVVHHLQ
jgi:hypothetical protein